MRKAICPLPEKRVFFIKNRFQSMDKLKNFMKLISFSAAILLITGMSTNAFGETFT